MTLYQIWDLVSYIAGKFPSGGAIPPARFNLLAPQVQDEWYQQLLGEVMAASANQMVLDKILSTTPLIPFKQTILMAAGGEGNSPLPIDYNRYISAQTKYAGINNSGGTKVRKIDIVSDDLFAKKRGDIFTRAGITPFAKINSYGVWVVPFDIEDYTLDYFRKPDIPFMDWCQDGDNPNRIIYMPVGSAIYESNTQEVYELRLGATVINANVIRDGLTTGGPGAAYASKTVELEYDNQYHYHFVYLMLAKCGVNLSEDLVVKYAMEMGK